MFWTTLNNVLLFMIDQCYYKYASIILVHFVQRRITSSDHKGSWIIGATRRLFRWKMAVYFSEIIWPILCFLLVTYFIYLLWVVFERISRIRNLDGRTILITGCDSGFGHDLAVRCLRRGMNVFAACLTEKVVHKIMLPLYLLIRSCLWM